MTNLRYLILFMFLSGMFFDSFLGSLVNRNMGEAIVFMLIAVIELWFALKHYDKLKVK